MGIWANKVNVEIVRILLCFQEEILVQEDPTELEKMMTWSKKTQTKKGTN